MKTVADAGFIWAALNILCVCVTSVCHVGTEFESSIFSRDYLKFGGECEELFLQEHICIRVLLRSPRSGFFTLDNTQRKHCCPVIPFHVSTSQDTSGDCVV